MRRAPCLRRALRALLPSVLLVASVALCGPPALAGSSVVKPADPTCPSGSVQDTQVISEWRPSNGIVDGIRAPVELRTDGLLCTDYSPYIVPVLYDWIGIESSNNTEIAQIGWEHTFGSDGSEYCRFWAIDGGENPTSYDCTGQMNKVYVYFRIQVDVDQTYQIDDCGTEGDFNDCTQENANESVFSSAYDVSSSEALYACTTEILGDNADPVNFGTSSWGQVGEDGSGWDDRSWTTPVSTCGSDYDIYINGHVVSMWDSRETS